MDNPTIAPADFRDTLGQYPTGVCVITTLDSDTAVGMTVGSFSSISLDPPIVGFFIDKSSRRLPIFRRAGRYCVNVLAAAQSGVCRHFARNLEGLPSQFADQASPSGLPLIKDAVAWIDCEISDMIDIGDHLLVVGSVKALRRAAAETPMVFLQGRFCQVAAETPDCR